MSRQDDSRSLDSVRVSVGLSAYIGITAGAFVNTMIVKFVSGGTCEIMGVSGQVVGSGYPFLSVGDSVTMGGPTGFWLASSGATSVVSLIKTKTSEVT